MYELGANKVWMKFESITSVRHGLKKPQSKKTFSINSDSDVFIVFKNANKFISVFLGGLEKLEAIQKSSIN